MSGTRENVESQVDKWLASETPSSETTQDTTDEATQPAEGERTDAAPPQDGQPASEQSKPDGNTQRTGDKPQPGRQGDLVVNGEVVARAGAERRHYEAAVKATRETDQVRRAYAESKSQLDTTRAELKAFREAAHLPQQLGLTIEDTNTGLQLVASWKANPVGVIQYLVEQAKAMGHSIDGIGGSTDIGAIRSMISNELAPLRDQGQRQQQEQEAITTAQSQIQELVGEYGPQVLTNGDALAKIIDASQQAGRALTLEQAYFRFSKWCNDNGMDPHSPIDPQIQGARTQQQPQTRGQQPRPNGRAPANAVVPMGESGSYTGAENTRDLVRAAMREQGFNV